MVRIEKSWYNILEPQFQAPYFARLAEEVRQAYRSGRVYPKGSNIFRAFDLCPFEQVKVVILGQDPYHGAGQANGLSFSVPEGVELPPSLVNIYKELSEDMGLEAPKSGDLTDWAKQGVLLLNASLTVVEHKPGSHSQIGWQTFTDEVIRAISEKKEHVVFILWGAFAQSKERLIDKNKHLILKSPHPSPLSAYRGFFGSKPFSQTNAYLVLNGLRPIEWILETKEDQ